MKITRLLKFSLALLAMLLWLATESPAQILYSQLVSTNPSRFQLRQVNGDGSGDTAFGLPFSNVIFPAWSRDAGLLAISAPDPNRPNDPSHNVYTINPANGAVLQQITLNRLTSDPQTGAFQFTLNFYKAFSPDRNAMAVSSVIVSGNGQVGQNQETPVLGVISTAPPTNFAFVRVYPTERGSFTHHGGEGVDWHPAQNVLVAPVDWSAPYQSDPSLSGQVTALLLLEPVDRAVEQGRFRQITFPRTDQNPGVFHWSEHDYQPRFSPNGVGVAYVRSLQNLSPNSGAEPNLQSLRILNLNTGGETEVRRFSPGSYVTNLDWSPDGTALVFDLGQQANGINGLQQRAVPETHEIYIINVDGTGLRRLRGAGAVSGAWKPFPSGVSTPTGNNVTVRSPSGDASVTFPAVSQAGATTFAPINPAGAGTPPAGYTILNNAPAYDITTSAVFTPPVTVCHSVPTITSEAEFARVRILHAENGQLIDRTILAPDSPAPNFATRTVCGRVNSLSPFVTALAPTATPPNPRQLLNIATRMHVGTDPNQLIGGFIIDGSEPKTVIILATGPSLAAFGLQGVLGDPVLELFQGNTLIASNDNWKIPARADIEATQLQPSHDFESALVRTLEPGGYTAIVRGATGTGVGTVQVYDLATTSNSKLANISSRGSVQPGDENAMIAGFIIGGGGDARVVVRALGPSLAAFGIAGIPDPTLELKNAQGTTLLDNDDWPHAATAAEISSRGLAPGNAHESALAISLPNGDYTAIVRGKGGASGVAVVEVYNVE